MNHQKLSLLLVMALVLLWVKGSAQKEENSINGYVEFAMKNNLMVKQQEISLEKSLQLLKEAKGLFLPSFFIEARYSRAGGGRMIDMPIGEMVNPIHETLNQLLLLNGFKPIYPGNIPNQRIPFLREKEQDTKLRLIQPLFQPGIYHNYKIQKELNFIEKAKLVILKRQLILDIKSAYYNFKKSEKIDELLKNTRGLLQENLNLNQSLFKNHKRTEEVVFRSQAELSKIEEQLAEAEKNIVMASAYFNFLLNRPLEEKIHMPQKETIPEFTHLELNHLITHALLHRSEVQQIDGGVRVARHNLRLQQSKFLPSVTAVVDYGYQGESYTFGKGDDYWMGSMLFSWNLFRGGQDSAKNKQALLQKKSLVFQKQQLEYKIKLQVTEAFHNLDVARKKIVSSRDRQKSSEETFLIIDKKYRQGMIAQIEYLKAQNEFIGTQINQIVATYDYFVRQAELERYAALIPLK